MDNMAGLGTALPARQAGAKAHVEDPDLDDQEADIDVREAVKQAFGGPEGRSGLAAALQGGLDSLVGRSSGFDILETLPAPVRRRVETLRTLDGEYQELEAQFLAEKAELEAKYQNLYQPLFVKRADIVAGRIDSESTPDDEPVSEKPETMESAEDEGPSPDNVGVPEFWLRAMKNHELLDEQITARDEGPLKFLVDIKSDKELGEDTKGFRLHFHFLPNPYFSNSILTKSYFMVDEEDPILEKAEGTEINWQSGKNTTVKIMKKKPKKGSKNTKPVTKTEQCESFFNFFSPPKIPEDDEDIDDEEAERLQEVMEADYEMGAVLREKVIPRAVTWYTGEAIMDDDDEDEEDDDEEDDDEGDDDDDDEDEEEDEESSPIKQQKHGIKGPAAPAAGQEQPPECKQQ